MKLFDYLNSITCVSLLEIVDIDNLREFILALDKHNLNRPSLIYIRPYNMFVEIAVAGYVRGTIKFDVDENIFEKFYKSISLYKYDSIRLSDL